MSQLKKGALLSYITILLSNIIGLLLTPYIIRSLGDAQYGLYSLIGALVAYISILDFGLNNTIVRFVSKYRAENNKKGEENFLAITMRLYVLISIIVVCVGLVLYRNFDVIFDKSLTAEEMAQAKIMFVLLIFNLAITLPGGAYTAMCSAYEHFVYPRTIKIIRYVVRAAAVVALLCFGGDAVELVALDTVINILVILFIWRYVKGKLKLKFKLHSISIPYVKEILSFSIWIFIYAVVHQFQWNAGQVILGINLDTVAVGVFAVGVMLGGYYAAFGGVINSVLIPKANQVVVADFDGLFLTKMMIKYARLNALILSLVLCGFLLFGKEFISLWIGEEYSLSYVVGLLMMFGLTILLIQGFGNSILEAQNKNRFKSILSLTTVCIAVLIGYILSYEYGILGVVVPISAAMVVNGLIMFLYFKKTFNFKPFFFLNQSFSRVLISHSLLTAFFFYIKSYFVIENWINLLIFISIFSLFYILVTYFFILNSSEKNIISNRFR